MSKQSQSIATMEIKQRRAANDAFRRDRTRGAVMLSLGIIDLGRANQSVALAVVRSMTGYDDDPDDDHSIGDVEVICGDPDVGLATHLVFFKIMTLLQGDVPERVLVVMLASEWWRAGDPVDHFFNGLGDGPDTIEQASDDDDDFIISVEDCTLTPEEEGRRADKIRSLNDTFRKTMVGGTVVVTAGIMALDPTMQQKIIDAVKVFDAFTEDNDPWGEHDMGAFEVDGHRVFFKLDYYDLTRSRHSDDPTDPSKTERVLTIMLAEEY